MFPIWWFLLFLGLEWKRTALVVVGVAGMLCMKEDQAVWLTVFATWGLFFRRLPLRTGVGLLVTGLVAFLTFNLIMNSVPRVEGDHLTGFWWVARYDIEDELPDAGDWHDKLLDGLPAIGNCAAVAISDYGYGCVQPGIVDALRQTVGCDTWISLDSRYRIGDFVGVDGATPNLEELEVAVGRRLASDCEVADAAAELRSNLDARFLLATRGNRGMTLATADGTATHLPVFGSDEVADVTGAGDTVLAVLTAALAAGASPLEGAALANIAAGLVVMKLGTATITADELRGAITGETS